MRSVWGTGDRADDVSNQQDSVRVGDLEVVWQYMQVVAVLEVEEGISGPTDGEKRSQRVGELPKPSPLTPCNYPHQIKHLPHDLLRTNRAEYFTKTLSFVRCSRLCK